MFVYQRVYVLLILASKPIISCILEAHFLCYPILYYPLDPYGQSSFSQINGYSWRGWTPFGKLWVSTMDKPCHSSIMWHIWSASNDPKQGKSMKNQWNEAVAMNEPILRIVYDWLYHMKSHVSQRFRAMPSSTASPLQK